MIFSDTVRYQIAPPPLSSYIYLHIVEFPVWLTLQSQLLKGFLIDFCSYGILVWELFSIYSCPLDDIGQNINSGDQRAGNGKQFIFSSYSHHKKSCYAGP